MKQMLLAVFLATTFSFSSLAQSDPPATSGAATGNQDEALTLEQGQAIARTMAGGERHRYQITLRANQFLDVVVEPSGIDVAIILLGADQKPLLVINNSDKAVEQLLFVSEKDEQYRLIIQPVNPKALPGRYEIKLNGLRLPSAIDQADANSVKAKYSFYYQKKYAEALNLQTQALETLTKEYGPESPRIGVALKNLADMYYGNNEYEKAKPLNQRLAAIREKELGNLHPDLANLLHWHASMAHTKGDYAEAERLYQRVITILENKFGQESQETLFPINNFAALQLDKGEYVKAEGLFRRALAVQQKLLPADSPIIAGSLANLAATLYKEGEYLKAEPLYLQAKMIWEKQKHPNVFQAINGVAIIQFERGDYEQAERLWQQALELAMQTSKQESEPQAVILGSLGLLYFRKSELEKAESFQFRALEAAKKVYGAEHQQVAITLNFLGDLYSRKGETTKAQQYYQQALEMLKKTVGPDNPNVSYSLHHMGQLSLHQQDYGKAETLFQEALQLREKLLGNHHPDVAETLGEMAQLSQIRGEGKRALEYQARANEINEANLRQNIVVGSERQKQSYLALFTKSVNATLNLQTQLLPQSPDAAALALQITLRHKGRSLDAMSDTMAITRRHATTEQQRLIDRLLVVKSQLANLTLRGLKAETSTVYRSHLKQLEDEIDQLEADLSRRSSEFSTEVQPITLQAIQAALPAQTRLLEFVTYQPYQSATKTFAPLHYLAYVLSSDGTIRWTELGEAKFIDQAVADLRLALRNPKRNDVTSLARQVDEKVMQPVRSLLGEAKHLLISPDGMLNLLPFAALVDERGKWLVSNYEISYLTSGRDLLRMQSHTDSKGRPLVVADPDFGVSPVPMNPAQTIAMGRDFDLSKASFKPLPGTAEEAQALKTIMPDALILTREKATETALKQAASPRILHIATHGFFLAGAPANLASSLSSRSIEHLDPAPPMKTVANPLLRSGLGLAGANQHKSGADDGILTALEVTGLNLWGTKLVVLSACDTGVGEVKNGDGVYGLRRALVLAGAETQVMSLWPVSDQGTRDLMIEYYRRLQAGEGRSEALRQVQLNMLKGEGVRGVKPVNAGKSVFPGRSHPYYWASFIPSGEWANLEGKR